MTSSIRGSRPPIHISDKSPVLVSHIPLPTLPSIAYAKFVPILQHEQQHKAVELARQYIINGVRRRGKSIEGSLLPIVHIGREDVALWVFSIRSLVNTQDYSGGGKGKDKEINKEIVSVSGELEDLAFDSLQRSDLSQFTPSALYPCSSECAELAHPCSSCTNMLSGSSIVRVDRSTVSASASATLFPRLPLRTVYTLFIDAVRDRLIDDICYGLHRPLDANAVGTHVQALGRSSPATRLGHGFLSNRDHIYPTWGCGWEQRSHNQPLVHTSLDIYMSPTAIHIRPLPTLTRLLPVPMCWSPSSSSRTVASNPSSDPTLHSPPLTPGTPLILSPYSTPGFYVSTHAGTSVPNSLRAEFWDALTGLGTFSIPPHSFNSSSGNPFIPNAKQTPGNACGSHLLNEPFLLVFIPLLNPQGEPKGVTALWPARLAFIDTSPNRFHLTSLPEMPGTEALLTPPRGAGAQPSAQAPCPTSPPPFVRRRSSVPPQFGYLGRTQRAFRALELSSHRRASEVLLCSTAKSTAGYVESVAKERERERERAIQERIRREREAKESKPPSSGVVLVPSNATNNVHKIPQAVGDTPGIDSASPKTIVDIARPGYSWHSVPTNFFAKAAQDSVVHSFYPSPPDWNPVSSTQNSGILESTGNIATASATSSAPGIPHSQSGSNVNQQAARESIDMSNGIDLGMDIDMNDMSMGINLGSTMGMLDVNMGVNMDASSLLDGGFGNFTDAFTDDDFNYFDAAPAPEPIPLTPDIQRPLHLSADAATVDGWLTDGLGEAGQGGNVISSQLQPVTPASVDATRDSFAGLHQMLEDDSELLPPAPDLIPSSPAKTPWSPNSPPTPSLELNAPPASPVGKRMFEPIYFGSRHHVADGKYRDINGKFAFPNTLPRPSPLSPLSIGILDVSSGEKEDGWKLRYDAITDPRVGVINRLRGVKRKLHDKGHASKKRLRDEEWESVYGQTEDVELPEETSSSEEEEEIEEMELEQDQSDDSSSLSRPSRPSTPPPTGLPLTATLLYSHFHHAHLLALGMPMRPSYGELVSHHNPPAPTSVPTPVSPAAALGNATERNKTLELLAQAIAKEAVENHVWAQAWESSLDGPLIPHSSRMCHDVPPTDIKHIARLMEKIPGMKGPSLFSELLDYPCPSNAASPHTSTHGKSLQMLPSPRISIGRAGLVHHMFPTAIRFWEKEGLGPRGGSKDVVAFALFEEGEDKEKQVQTWMERVGRVYSARGFGTHTAGHAGTFEPGLVPVQFETVRKILPNLMSVLPREPQHIVIYIIAPPAICSSLKSPALRAILMSQKRGSKLGGQHDFDQDRVLIHFVPDHFITDPYTYPNTRHVGLELLASSVYDRLLRATSRQTSRQFWKHNPSFQNKFRVPSFTLSRTATPHTQLEWDERPSLNVLDRHTFLHVGYRLSACKRWLLAACIDERGEAHEVAVWGVLQQNDPQAFVTWMVSSIWIFVKQFAQCADTEWRIVVSKLGEIGEIEVEKWMSHLETMVSTHTGPPVHVSLVCAQSDIPLPFLCPSESVREKQTNTSSGRGAVFTDVSSVTYSVCFPHRTPIISPGLLCPWEHPSLVVPTASGDDQADTLGPTISILPLSTTALLRVPNNNGDSKVEALYIHLLFAYKSAKSTLKKTTHEVHADITRNWYDLAVLTRERWHFSQQRELPFHLAALELMSNVLHPTVLTPDAKDVDYLGS